MHGRVRAVAGNSVSYRLMPSVGIARSTVLVCRITAEPDIVLAGQLWPQRFNELDPASLTERLQMADPAEQAGSTGGWVISPCSCSALLFQRAHRPEFGRIADVTVDKADSYMIGNILISLIAGLAAFVALTVLGVPFAVPLAFVVAVTDLIPMIGAPPPMNRHNTPTIRHGDRPDDPAPAQGAGRPATTTCASCVTGNTPPTSTA
jgi:hypothetical protein